MNELEIAKKVIKENIEDARCGIFNTENIVRDPMAVIYDKFPLEIDICYPFEYFEVFGLTQEEFKELKDFYNELLETIDEEEEY